MNIILIKNIQKQLDYFLNFVSNKYIYVNSNDYDIFIIKNIKNELFNLLNQCTSSAMILLNNLNSNLINKNKNLNEYLWKICIYEKIFFELPFTLDDIIFIPYSYLNKCYDNNDHFNFTKTLIHERIHILQRFNINIWNNYIKNNTKWSIIFNKNLYKLNIKCSFLKDIQRINNPDTFYLDYLYIYNFNNNYYYAYLYLNNNKVITKWFIIKKINIYEYDLYPINEDINEDINKYDHPFEEMAYKITNKILLN